jgi:hypothetical protein
MATQEEALAFRVPQGRYDVTAALDERLRSAARAPGRHDAESAHPIMAFVAALGGMGMSIRELSEALGLAFAQGPVLGGCHIRLHRPVAVDKSYLIDTRVSVLQRKPSRRFGLADHLTLAFEVTDGSDRVCDVELAMVFPGGEAA